MVSTVAESQAQWYDSKGSGTVVFRSEQQVVLPHAGRATVYRAGREIIMSSAGVGKTPQQEKPPFSSSASNALSRDNFLQLQDGLTDARSPKGSLTAIPDASNSSPVESWLESCMTQPRSATVSDTQRQRCVLLPNPAFTSKEDANTLREEAVSLNTLREDCGTQSKATSQRLSKPFTASRSERARNMPEPSGPAESGSELERIQARIEKTCSSGSPKIWSESDAGGPAGEIRMLGALAGSQESAPGDPKTTTRTVLREEQSDPPRDSQVSAWEPTSPIAESNASHDPLRQKTGSSSKTAEEEPEEAVDMELFVDTLRNMEPPELLKPLKLPTRPPRPSKLSKHVPLPPIHEHHATPKSKVPLPAALGELFALEEERNSEEEKGGKEEDGKLAEEVEVIVNPYPSKDEMLQYDRQVRKPYPWENQLYKTEEEIGSFLGKLQQGSVHQKTSTATAVKAAVSPNNFIRASVLKGLSLVSDFADKKVPEEKPYSRLDNSLLYSKFICPEKSQFRPVENGKEGRCSPTPLIPAVVKVNRECQTSPNGLQVNVSEELRSMFSLSEPRAEPSSEVPSANGSSSQISLLSNEVLPQHMEKKVPKINVRPGKIILYSESGFGGQKREIWGDITDATSWELSHTISIRVVRGGWVMYEKPRFHGRKCVLAEGDVEITNPWKMYRKKGPTASTPFSIGSLKRIVRDYKIPEIALFSEENGEGAKWKFTDSAEDTRIHNRPLKAASIIVHSGLWLVYSKPFFDDDPYVLEPGGYPNLQAWGAKDSSVCSLHPIKLGCPVVEKPGEPKALIYEEPHFQGRSWEVSRDIYNVKKPESSQDSKMPTVGSLKILGGCWVGYEKEGFRGHQYLLEEGEYRSWSQWGGFNEQLVSLRLIRTDFLDPALVLFEAMDFEDGPSVELCEALPDVELASYGSTTQSIHVLSGVWVAYEDKNFTGEQYILEKGVYRNCEDWGASNCQISSLQPILQVGEHSLHFISKLQLFSDPDFLGKHISFTEDQASLPENFIPHSCRVHGGSWILYDRPQFDGEQHVLSEGEYPSLTSMGCLLTTAVRSLKKVPIFFSEPSIFLHGLECFEGKEIELNSEVRSLQAEGFNNHVLSVRVKGGIWVLCEHSDFRGRQWLLNCMEITNWLTYSGLQHIGSLYPIRQKRIYFQIKNEELKSFLSVPDDVEDMKAGRVLVSELSDKISSIWYYEEGLLKNQVAPSMSLQVIGPAGKGAKVVLWSESRMPRQAWQIDSFGRICSQMFEDKVLDVKGGRTYDRDHAILWELSEKRPTQIWDVQVL
ncbi:beta/gamma crystallin domain-containing protein 2 [Tiliqua scincoides]|uniref:beta/gamma crystallin domain-containing protein 2 n=1 Tax=Tiliqua scincoides TaxID=71010 RepID=UPI0034619AF6